MNTNTTTNDSRSNARNKLQAMFAQDVVDACVNKNICPWQSPVFGKVAINARSADGYCYTGVNNVFLALRMLENGWTHPFFGTSLAWKRHGVTPNKKYKTSSIVYYKLFKKLDEKGNPVLDEKGNPIEYPIMKYSRVINVEQTDADIEKYSVAGHKTVDDSEAFDSIVKVFEQYTARTKVGLAFCDSLNRGTYVNEADTIRMPNPDRYSTTHAFCEDFLHQMAVSTAHDDRVGISYPTDARKLCIMELAAEMASSIMMYILGIEHTKQQDVESWKAYCKEWAEKIKADPGIIWKAAGNATKIAEYILGTSFSEKRNEEKK